MTMFPAVQPRPLSVAISLVLLLLLGSAGAEAGQQLTNETKLIPVDPPLLYSGAGYSVAISGTTAVVGAPFGGANAWRGSAHVFVWSGSAWAYQATLISDDPDDFDYFGSSVAIQGDTILVAAPYTYTATFGIGAVFVFERTGTMWTQTARLQAATNFGADTFFGVAVALDGDTAVVSDYANADAGRLVVVSRVNGVWDVAGQAVISSVNPEDGSFFGASLAIQGDIIVAGAPGDSVFNQQNQGTAQIFKREQGMWSAFGTLITNESGAGDKFGSSVAIDEDLIVVGAKGKNNNAGAAYVFHKNGDAWTSAVGFWAKLVPQNPQLDELFGFSVAKRGGFVLVGAPGRDSYKGAAFLFDDLTGTSNGSLHKAGDGVADDQFGWSTALDGKRAVIGATIQGGIGVGYAYDVRPGFRRFNWTFILWPYKYIYMGCPIEVFAGSAATIAMERGDLPLSFEIGRAPRHGTLRFTDATTLEYRPDRGYAGTDIFTVRVTDRAGVSLEKTANVTVVPVR